MINRSKTKEKCKQVDLIARVMEKEPSLTQDEIISLLN